MLGMSGLLVWWSIAGAVAGGPNDSDGDGVVDLDGNGVGDACSGLALVLGCEPGTGCATRGPVLPSFLALLGLVVVARRRSRAQ